LFNLVLPMARADQGAGARVIYRVVCQDTFVPAQVDEGSTDSRELAFLVEGCETVR
jgi:hypothetical protein